MNIAVSSGKGGTGKTFAATNLAAVLASRDEKITYLDCDVEAPNGQLFLKPEIENEETIEVTAPAYADKDKCILCGRCAEVCTYNAIAVTAKEVIFFPELCHVCGACTITCPVDAVVEKKKTIGLVRSGVSRPGQQGGEIAFHYALLQTAEGGMSPRLISRVKEKRGGGINIFDSPPGTACPVVETVKDADLVVLVTDPTPFGINDCKLAVEMSRKIGREPVILINRSGGDESELMEYCQNAHLRIIGRIPDDRNVAEIYSTGCLAVTELPEYRKLFEKLADDILEAAARPQPVGPLPEEEGNADILPTRAAPPNPAAVPRPEELVVISGKGGTGKTSLTASFAALDKNAVVSDCDVDAADLHLLLAPRVEEKGTFSGGYMAKILPDKCIACGACFRECRFDAIEKETSAGEDSYRIDPLACEGCGVCDLVCPPGAIELKDAVNGEWYVSTDRLDQPMTHAKLGIAEENSGRLVTLIREKAVELAGKDGRERVIIDGSPGTGCPVIASLTGASGAVVVTEPTVSGVHDLARILDVTRHFGVPSRVVINKCDLNREMAEKIEEVAGSYGAEVIGEIPYDNVVTEAQREKRSVVEYSDGQVARAVRNIWEKLR